jgi:ceramide glucosyltransferase
MDYVVGLLLAASLAGSLYLLFAANAVVRFTERSRPQLAPGAAAPPVTVLKPLHGLDPGLHENLLSFCDQDYPGPVQIVCGVRDPLDSAVGVVERLRAERPDADITLVVDPRVYGTNYKISNLENMTQSAPAKHDVLVIVDSDMRVAPNYLAEVTSPLADPAVGLVTCLYKGQPADGSAWSRLGAAFINFGFLPSVLVGDRLGSREGCFGATMALTRRTLDAVGGFATFRDHLADDHALGAAVRALGLGVELSPHVVTDILVERSAAALVRHELRWARTIRAVAPWSYLGSFVTHPVVLALLGVLLSGFALTAWVILAISLAARATMVRLAARALQAQRPSWPLLIGRDLLSFAVFVASFCGSRIAWRDHRFRLGPDGRLTLSGDSRA